MKQIDSIAAWLSLQSNLGLSCNTIAAYKHALKDYIRFCNEICAPVETATREHISLYVRSLLTRPLIRSPLAEPVAGALSNATIRQRLTAVRLYYDYLIEEGVRQANPVGRGSRVRNRSDVTPQRPLVPRHHKLPWIPNEEEWKRLLDQAKKEPIRNRLMFAFAYDAALRREELCLLAASDIDPSRRLLHLRALTTKGKRDRIVPYSAMTGKLMALYLKQRRRITLASGTLFISESPRNFGQPISSWTWSKVIQRIAADAGVPQFTTHSFRHLCLTDLARSDWELHEIATFAGHRNISTTMLYIHLSGRDLATKLRVSTTFHTERLTQIAEGML